MMKPLLFRLAALALGACVSIGSVFAQSGYPNKPIRWVVGWPPGGGVDTIARLISGPLSASLGQPIVIDNRPGATGMIGADNAAKSPADGYTIATSGNQELVLNPQLYSKVTYGAKDFDTVTLVAKFPLLLVVNDSVPAKSFKEFVAYAKANPGKLNYASFGAGSGNHVGMEMLAHGMGIKMLHVPYKGAAPAVNDLLGGTVNAMLLDYASGIKQLASGKIRVLAVATAERLPALPDIPTIAESGVPGFDVFFWQGIVTPVGVPADIRARLHRELVKVMAQPEIKARFNEIGILLIPSTPEEFAELRRRDTERWGSVIKTMGLTLD